MTNQKRPVKYIGKFKPRGRWEVLTPTEINGPALVDLLRCAYVDKHKSMRGKLDEIFVKVYGRALVFKDKDLGTICSRIRGYEKETGREFLDMVADIKDVIDEPLYRNSNGKSVPIEGDRLLDAYLAINEGKPLEEVKNILYL